MAKCIRCGKDKVYMSDEPNVCLFCKYVELNSISMKKLKGTGTEPQEVAKVELLEANKAEIEIYKSSIYSKITYYGRLFEVVIIEVKKIVEGL